MALPTECLTSLYPELKACLEKKGIKNIDWEQSTDIVSKLPMSPHLISAFVQGKQTLVIVALKKICIESTNFKALRVEFDRLIADYISEKDPATVEKLTNISLCHHCDQPIQEIEKGTMFKCMYCVDYKLCATCEGKFTSGDDQVHDILHFFVKIPAGKTFTWRAVWEFRNKQQQQQQKANTTPQTIKTIK